MKIDYLGKALLLNEDGKKVLVVSDLHLGYREALRRSGIMVPSRTFEETKKDIHEIFSEVKYVDELVVLGDLKHVFSSILREESNEINELLDYLRDKTGKIVIIKGNHDALVNFMGMKDVEIKDYYLWNDVCFAHGDRDFEILYSKEVNYWILGHAHPAITLTEGSKIEKYKCFLEGVYKKKKVIIVPSFFPINEGTDPREFDLGLAWNFDLMKFNVKVVDGLKNLDFGVLNRI